MRMHCPKHGMIEEPTTVGFITTMLIYGPVVNSSKPRVLEASDPTPVCPRCLGEGISDAVKQNFPRLKPVKE